MGEVISLEKARQIKAAEQREATNAKLEAAVGETDFTKTIAEINNTIEALLREKGVTGERDQSPAVEHLRRAGRDYTQALTNARSAGFRFNAELELYLRGEQQTSPHTPSGGGQVA